MKKPLRILITAGSTREPIDPVRFIGNRSSGKMGAALVQAALNAGHDVTLIAGPLSAALPEVRRIDVETAAEMQAAVLSEFANHDVLIMAAAVADFRPVRVSTDKLSRSASLTIECEPTADIVATVALAARPDQRVVTFSLESDGNLNRAREKMIRKRSHLMVFNQLNTMGSDHVNATLLFPCQPDEPLGPLMKSAFAHQLINRIESIID